MPMIVDLEAPGRFVVHATGNITTVEILDALNDVVADPAFAPGATILVLAKQVTGAPSTKDLWEIARVTKSAYGRGLQEVAIVTEAGFAYGVARMFSVISEIVGIGVSAHLDEAEARAGLQGRPGAD